MFHGICLVFAAAFLITPGFFTDAVGFLLLLPPVRTAVIRLVLSRMQVFQAAPQDDTVIDGDWRDVTPENPPRNAAPLPRQPPR